MIKLQDYTPDVYYNESRDFQFIGRLYDIVLNYVKTNADLLYDLPLSDNSDSQFIELLAFTLGFQPKHKYTAKHLRAICSVFSDILRNVLQEEQRYIFYQEILELILNDVGDISKLKIVQLLRNRKYAGEQFVNSYIEFLRNRNKANNALKRAITAVDFPVINYGNIYKYLRYNSALDLQFLKIGVINNGKE